MVASALSGRLAARFDHRRLMLIGLLTACIGLALWALSGLTPELRAGVSPSYAVLVVAMVGCGFGTSFTLTGATATVMAAAPDGYAGTASAALNTARQTGSAAGVAISGSLIALSGLTTGVATFMAVGSAGYLLGAVLTLLCVPATRR
jgi:DHA2 family methylenomycin A resistance protein-like MFS transporter